MSKDQQPRRPWNFKTRLCRQFTETGKCRFGANCTFAHGADELRVFEDWDESQWQQARCVP
jgi:hypothetical protein